MSEKKENVSIVRPVTGPLTLPPLPVRKWTVLETDAVVVAFFTIPWLGQLQTAPKSLTGAAQVKETVSKFLDHNSVPEEENRQCHFTVGGTLMEVVILGDSSVLTDMQKVVISEKATHALLAEDVRLVFVQGILQGIEELQ